MEAESFTDRMGRTIVLVEMAQGIHALHEERLVGWLSVVQVELEKEKGKATEAFLLKDVEVLAAFHCAGVGLELLTTAKEWFYPLQVPEDGPAAYMALLNAGKRNGLLLKPWPKEHSFLVKMRKGRGSEDF